MLKVKLLSSGKSLKPYISRVVTGGKVQNAFKEQIGIPTGKCVKSKVTKGMSQGDIRKAVKDCAPAKGSVKLKI